VARCGDHGAEQVVGHARPGGMVRVIPHVVDVVLEDVAAHGRVPLYDGVRRVGERHDRLLLEVVERRRC
jgi:hypothetical protein